MIYQFRKAWVDAVGNMTAENAVNAGDCENIETCEEKDFCGPGNINSKPSFLYNESNCFGNSFYLGIYGAIGVAIALISFTKVESKALASIFFHLYHIISFKNFQ